MQGGRERSHHGAGGSVRSCVPSPGRNDRVARPLGCLLALMLSLVACSASEDVSHQPTTQPPSAALTPASPTGAPPSATPMATSTPAPTSATGTSAIRPGRVNRTTLSLVATYDADVTLGYAARTLGGTVTITARNASGDPIDRVELNTITARLGALRLSTVRVDGKAVTAPVRDQTILVPLGGVLPDGGTVTIRVDFRATLRSGLGGSDWLFTRTNGVVDAYRWLPWVSLARPFDRPNYGDPFITASSPLVRVRITTDRSLVIAATGRRVGASGLTQTFEARNVRDFTLTASPDFHVTSATVGTVQVNVYARDGYQVTTVLSYAKDAIGRMAVLAGDYPYPTFTVVQSAGGDGMESPELIWIPGGVAGRQLHWLVYHETAHQWFYGLVGSDQAYQPFADEASADHLARTVSGLWRASRCATQRLDLSIYRYPADCYFEVIYVQGSLLLDDVRKTMGSAAYWSAIRGYVSQHRYGMGSTRELLDALQAHTTRDLRPILAPRLPSMY